MFEDALLESSPRRAPVLRRIHYLLSTLAGTLVFTQGLYLLPLLVPAALEAVKTWRYQPTLLNSEPVEVLTEIDMIFTLGE